MVQAKCMRCLGSAIGDTFEEASDKINHAVGLSRGKPCGDNYGRVVEIGVKTVTTAKPTITKTETIPTETPKVDSPKSINDEKPKSEKPVKSKKKPFFK